MYGEMGAQVPNFVYVREGEAIYCAVYGDLIDYNVYPKAVPMDEIEGNYYDDGTHGDEVPYDGIPSNIIENRDTYLGPFAIKYKNMLKKAVTDTIMSVMDRGAFGLLQRARKEAAAQRRDVMDVLGEARRNAQDSDLIRVIEQAQRLAQNQILLELLGEAKDRRAKILTKTQGPLEFYRIPVAAENKESKLVSYESVNNNLTEKIEEWADTLLAQFIGPDGEPYDDETYRFRLDVTILQNQQGLGLQGYGMGMYGGGPGGGPPGMFAIDRAREAASVAEQAGGEMPQ